jgi:hypothetical protein
MIGLTLIPVRARAQQRNQQIDPYRFIHTDFHPERLIVKLRGYSRPFIMALRRGENVLQEMSNLQFNEDVEYAEPDTLYTVDRMVPTDPYFGNLWGMETINAPEAWGLTAGTEEVVVAVIDTGVDYNHPDLKQNIWVNTKEIPGNGKDDDGNGYIDDYYGLNAAFPSLPPMDDNKHGTHVAGTIGAVGNNDIGVVGVNWHVKIMALKFLDKDGSGYLSDALDAIDYVIMMKRRGVNVRVVNASWGSSSQSQALEEAVARLRQEGILFVTAAGNDGKPDKSYPAGYSPALSVAAIEQGGVLAYFSNYGSWVDVAAPGRGILSTVPGNGYASFSGTSMATPHVAGVAALALSVKNDLTVDQLEQAILNGVVKNPALKDKTSTEGVIDAVEILKAAGASNPSETCQTDCPPTVSVTASNLQVDSGATVNFTANATDPDNDPLSYTWTTTGGTLIGEGSQVSLDTTGVNPTPGSSPVNVVVTATVNDGRGKSSTANRTITVRAPNQSPQASIEASRTTVQDGTLISLTAKGTDPDGDSLSYSWTASAGAITGSGSTIYLDTTDVNPTPDAAPVVINVNLTANDGRGGTATTTQQITVTALPKVSISAYTSPTRFSNNKATFYLNVKKHKSYKGNVQFQLVSNNVNDLSATIAAYNFLWFSTHRVTVTLKTNNPAVQSYQVVIRGVADDGKPYDSNPIMLVK